MPPDQVFAAVGACIYCGSTELPLSNEHIIPFGLGGDLILPKASCVRCATITSAVEGKCLGQMLGDFRSTAQLPTRRPQKRPKTIQVRHRDTHVDFYEDVEIAKYPLIALGYHFPPPGILIDGAPEAPIDAKVIVKTNILQWDRIRIPGKQLIVKAGTFNPLTFMRMLAKIGHAYAVATRGSHAFNPLLPGLILGTNNAARWLVGVDPNAENLPADPSPHELWTEIVKVSSGTYLLAGIRLFAPITMPKYHVVVGRLSRWQFMKLTYAALRRRS